MGPNGTYPLPSPPTPPPASAPAAEPAPPQAGYAAWPLPPTSPDAVTDFLPSGPAGPRAPTDGASRAALMYPTVPATYSAPGTPGTPGAPAAPAGPLASEAPTHTLRTWPAILALYLLAPMVGELLSGSTPPTLFFTPFGLIYECGLYGSGAVLARELARRRGLGWSAILLLGAAYGVLEEGLVVTSWFNPYWPDLGRLAVYGRALDTSWVWALGLTMYHAVVSITIPIVLVESLFPSRAGIPWLGRRALRLFTAWLALISVAGLVGFGFVAYHNLGYMHPPVMWVVALGLAAGLVWLALRMRPRPLPPVDPRPAPSLWALRRRGFFTIVAFFGLLWVAPGVVPVAVVVVVALLALGGYTFWRVRELARRLGWSAEHRLALATGALFLFILLAPLSEIGTHPKPMAGMTLAALVWLGGLIWLSRRAGRRRATRPARRA